jgi:phage tail protein X
MSITSYTAQEGDRWDLVSYKAYGDPYQIEALLAANPSVVIADTIPAGTVLNVPVIEQSALSSELLPPWKR